MASCGVSVLCVCLCVLQHQAPINPFHPTSHVLFLSLSLFLHRSDLISYPPERQASTRHGQHQPPSRPSHSSLPFLPNPLSHPSISISAKPACASSVATRSHERLLRSTTTRYESTNANADANGDERHDARYGYGHGRRSNGDGNESDGYERHGNERYEPDDGATTDGDGRAGDAAWNDGEWDGIWSGLATAGKQVLSDRDIIAERRITDGGQQGYDYTLPTLGYKPEASWGAWDLVRDLRIILTQLADA